MSIPLKVLIIEDSQDDLDLLLRELRRANYEPIYTQVQTSDAMIKALTEQAWEIVISDYSMPAFSAPEALAILSTRRPDIPFIVISGTIGEERAVEVLRLGARDFISKFSTTRLVPAVKRELQEAAVRRAHTAAERRLLQSEERFRTLVLATSQMVFALAPSGDLLEDSVSWRKFTGQTFDAIKGKGWLSAIHAEDLQKVKDEWNSASVEKRTLSTECRIANDKGAYERFLMTAVAVIEGAEIREWIAACTNITQRTKLEEQLRKSQRMDAVGQLAGGIAHDFNNLLTVINGRSQLLLDRTQEGNVIRRELEIIRKTGERAASLTKQLLAFSRQQVLQPKVLNLNEIASSIDDMLRRLIPENIELICCLGKKIAPVLADPTQVEQVIINLVVNARDAMPAGGKITIETSNIEVKEESTLLRNDIKPGKYCVLAVTDTGHGMDSATKSRIFEPFFTTKALGKGTGLGLSTVFGIVNQSGGYIDVRSEVNRGTTFSIYLPRAANVETPPSNSNLPAVISGSETILLVEDEEGVRDLVSDILEDNGYKVLRASNAVHALEMSRTHNGSVHLLMTDVVMPGMGGPELAEKLKPTRSEMRVLLTSGYTDNAVIPNRTLQPGVHFLQKPFSPQNLIQKIRTVLEGKD